MILHPFVIASDASHALIGLRRAPTTFDIFFKEYLLLPCAWQETERGEEERANPRDPVSEFLNGKLFKMSFL